MTEWGLLLDIQLTGNVLRIFTTPIGAGVSVKAQDSSRDGGRASGCVFPAACTEPVPCSHFNPELCFRVSTQTVRGG